MLNTIEAVLHADGVLHFLEPVRLKGAQRVLVTFTEQSEDSVPYTLMSEAALAVDWASDVEDAAWAHLQAASGDKGQR